MGFGSIRAAIVAGLAGLALTMAAPARAQTACPSNFEGRGRAVTCLCLAGQTQMGAVWGTGTYTTDSHVCRAALHAGAAPASGGLVTVTPAAGLSAYAGSTANGVTTLDYGPWQSSVTIVAAKPGSGPVAQGCPANFDGPAEPLTCACDAAAAAVPDPVWGTGVYTTDSRICPAAMHAGVIGPEGGTVNIVPAPGLPTYLGSSANGVTTMDYGPWQDSFTFQR